MRIAAFVDPGDSERQLALDLAIGIAEYAITEDTDLYLLGDRATALEIGLALLGMRPSRTVEGGDYRASSIVLLPPLERLGTPEDTLLSSADDNTGGGIEELYRLGVFSHSDVEGTRTGKKDPAVALERVIIESADVIIGLGVKSDLWRTVSKCVSAPYAESGRKAVVCIDGVAPEGVDVPFRVTVTRGDEAAVRREHVDRDEINEVMKEERDSAECGALVAGLFEFLSREL